MKITHRKSRLGCKECKERHIKCDETHPSCANCSKSKRNCSFVRLNSKLPANIRPQPLGKADLTGGTSSSSRQEPDTTNQHGAPHRSLLDEHYGVVHLELLHHAEHGLNMEMRRVFPLAEELMAESLKLAFSTAYLMDEKLALAAAHKSTLPGENQEYYRTEATRLQTRALTKFNAEAEISEEKAVATFVFTALIAQHNLFDIFSAGGDLASILDRFVHCMKLHQGIRKLVSPFWSKVKELSGCQISEWEYEGTLENAMANRECAPLLEMLDKSAISPSARQVYLTAIEALQNMIDTGRLFPTARMAVVQEWPARIPVEFIEFIGQQQPEALVVLAHYAVLLHQSRDSWMIGDAGRLLVRSITLHLGDYWTGWLQWPNSIVQSLPIQSSPASNTYAQ
ncbi:hypothetical protein BX600DRAFT_460769 [Xylariales sp. PMI_506]|nr:hypothetical protein BX600DRAFT_460769 [Xylariales sp. PMI_506]